MHDRIGDEEGEYLIMDRVYTLNEIITTLHPIFDTYGIRRAILFGSYARGEANEKSDVDLVVDCNQRGLKFYGIVHAIEDGLQKECDVFRSSSIVKDSPISKEIENSGVVIYENI